VTSPAIGVRFTCTSKTERKNTDPAHAGFKEFLLFDFVDRGHHAIGGRAAVFSSPAGTRSGSRKKYRVNKSKAANRRDKTGIKASVSNHPAASMAKIHVASERARFFIGRRLTRKAFLPSPRWSMSCSIRLESQSALVLKKKRMKSLAILLVVSCLAVVGCSGPGGPAQRAGAAVDNAVYKVGEGFTTVGKKIEGTANP
jgi:predicted small secreted protein